MPKILLLIILFAFNTCAQDTTRLLIPNIQTTEFNLGDSKISIRIATYGAPSKMSLIHLHGNEVTAKEVAISYLERHGGQLLSIENGNVRNIQFSLNNDIYEFDPNRIFTAEGIEKSLQLYSKVSTHAIESIAQLAEHIWKLIPDTSLIVALHNNTDAKYSVYDYLTGTLKEDAANVFLYPGSDADNFIFTTDASLFDYFKSNHVNAVLQKNITTINDGSMSVVLGNQKRSYINIEAEHGQKSAQLHMLLKLHAYVLDKEKLSSKTK